MKKILFLLVFFIIYTLLINFCPQVTALDRSLIIAIQSWLKEVPLFIPLLPDCVLYSIMIVIPLTGFGIFFAIRKKWLDLVIFLSIPLLTFLLNCIIKHLIHRPRPPYELQIAIHPESFSYVSSHSLVTCCLWGMVIVYIFKYCPSRKSRIIITMLSVMWILFVGISRIWLGVHNPTDVIGAYVLALLLLFIFKKVSQN